MSQYDPKLVRCYINIYVSVSFGGHNLGTFYAWKLKFSMLFTQTLTFSSVLELPLGLALGLS